MEDINLVLCDIRMPQMNGYELVTKFKTLKPKIKIILMSTFEIRKGGIVESTPFYQDWWPNFKAHITEKSCRDYQKYNMKNVDKSR